MDAIGARRHKPIGKLQRQSRLPAAARTGQRQETTRLRQTLQIVELALAPDEAGEPRWQVVLRLSHADA